jgi:dihydroorotate dehydrogenase
MGYKNLRPFFFHMDPELVHDFIIQLMWLVGKLSPLRKLIERSYAVEWDKPFEVAGLKFKNPIGLAAGFDKDAQGWRGLAELGFGHIELGTITPKPQAGNPKPRIFRIPDEKALINRMGFPGQGSDTVLPRVERRSRGVVLGVNIGKNKDTPNDEAWRDYVNLFRQYAPLADYIAVNVSSPNTVDLRKLQIKADLDKLVGILNEERLNSTSEQAKNTPIFVKISPDLNDSELDDILECIISNGMDGVIATNTTIRRDVLDSKSGKESGGLSGEPLKDISTEMIRKISLRTDGKLPIIGVGGVSTADDVREKLDAGASLVQVYTGLIYQGPGIVKQILRDL